MTDADDETGFILMSVGKKPLHLTPAMVDLLAKAFAASARTIQVWRTSEPGEVRTRRTQENEENSAYRAIRDAAREQARQVTL